MTGALSPVRPTTVHAALHSSVHRTLLVKRAGSNLSRADGDVRSAPATAACAGDECRPTKSEGRSQGVGGVGSGRAGRGGGGGGRGEGAADDLESVVLQGDGAAALDKLFCDAV